MLTVFKFFRGGGVNRIVERSIRFTNRIEIVSDTEILAIGRLQFVFGRQLFFGADATPFLNSVFGTAIPRKLHLMLTYWSFVLIGMHAGMHLGILSSKLKNKAVKVIAFVLMCGVTVCGFWLFIKTNIFDYMLMKTQFVFLDYSKPAWQIIIENLAMLLAWAFAAYLVSLVLKKIKRRKLYR